MSTCPNPNHPATDTMALLAEFPKLADAQAFAARIAEPGWWTHDIQQDGRRVTFTIHRADDLALTEQLAEWAATVGHYGSTQNRRAHLTHLATGHRRPCPISY